MESKSPCTIAYSREEMIDRVYESVNDFNDSNVLTSTKFMDPLVSRVNRKTKISNFQSICRNLNRDPEGVKKFIEEEFIKSSSIIGDGSLLISGMFKPMAVKKILGAYVSKYVLCPECKCKHTKIYKSKSDRMVYINCLKCKTDRPVV